MAISALDTVLTPIHRAGWPFIAAFALVSLILGHFWSPLGWIGLVATLWCVYFFRDPKRMVPERDGLILSPADGRVSMIQPAVPPPELGMGGEPMLRISIFLNIFNVHVNRVPASGVVTGAAYHPGKFLNAALDKASDLNERMSVRMRLADGRELAFVQIAGLVARRIVWDIAEGRVVTAGDRYGLIQFGSRMDVYLPNGIAPLVVVGQTALAGETVLADLHSSEPARTGRSN